MFFSKRFSLAWLVGILLLSSILVHSISTYLLIKQKVKETILDHALPLTSGFYYGEMHEELIGPTSIASRMSKDMYLRDWVISGEKDEAHIRRYLQSIAKDERVSTSYFISDKTRKYYYQDGIRKLIKEDNPNDSWYFKLSQSTESFIIDFDANALDENSDTAFINYRVLDYNGNFIGVTGVGIRSNRINETLKKYAQKYHHDVFFLRKGGDIKVGYSHESEHKVTTIYDIDFLKDHADDILNQKIDKLEVLRNGTNYFLYFRFLPATNSFLVVAQGEDKLLKPLHAHLIQNILIELFISLIICAICVYIIQRYHKRLEKVNLELKELNKEKDEFLGIVAHDLKTPIHGVMGLCDVVEMDIEDSEFKAEPFIKDLRDLSQRMLNLIHKLLDVCYIEASQEKLKLAPFLIQKSIREVFSQFKAHADKKHIKYQLKLANTEDSVKVISHAEWLNISLSNLLSNAIKYSPIAGEVSVIGQVSGKKYEILVTDTGAGIPKEEMPRLFEKFERLSTIPTAGESSNGLGLYIVKKMCDKSGVAISVESVVNKGSCFKLSIPLQ